MINAIEIRHSEDILPVICYWKIKNNHSSGIAYQDVIWHV